MRWETVFVRPRLRSIGECTRSDDNPVKIAFDNQRFLRHVIGKGQPQQHPEHDVAPEEIDIALAFADAERRLTDQAANIVPTITAPAASPPPAESP